MNEKIGRDEAELFVVEDSLPRVRLSPQRFVKYCMPVVERVEKPVGFRMPFRKAQLCDARR